MTTTFSQSGAGYTFTSTWAGHEVIGEVRGILPAGLGFKCEIEVVIDGSEVVTAPVNTGSQSGRDGLWRMLNRRRPRADYDIDWELWVHQVCNYVKENYSRGIPEIEASEIWDTVPEDDVFLLEPFILRNKDNVLFGDPSSAKSMLALFYAVLLDTGHVDSSHGVTAAKANCLYLDWEADSGEIIRRLKWLHKGMGIDSRSKIIYKRMTRSLMDDVDTIRDILHERFPDDDTPTVIFIDSQGMATSGLLSEEEQVVAFFTALRMIPATSLIISHTNKEGKLFGSQFTLAQARNVWEAVASTVSKQVIDIELHHRKSNSVGKEPMRNYRISFSRDPETNNTVSVTLKTQPLLESSLSPATMKIPALVLEIIKFHGPKSIPEIIEYICDYQEKQFSSDDEEKRFRGNIKTVLSRSKEIAPKKHGEITRYHLKDSLPDSPEEEVKELWEDL